MTAYASNAIRDNVIPCSTDPDAWSDAKAGGQAYAARACGHCPITAFDACMLEAFLPGNVGNGTVMAGLTSKTRVRMVAAAREAKARQEAREK